LPLYLLHFLTDTKQPAGLEADAVGYFIGSMLIKPTNSLLLSDLSSLLEITTALLQDPTVSAKTNLVSAATRLR
jgi:hypothetical protein